MPALARAEQVRMMRARIVARFEERTGSHTAGAWDQLVEAILEEVLDLEKPASGSGSR